MNYFIDLFAERVRARERMFIICVLCLACLGVQVTKADVGLQRVDQQDRKTTGVVLFEEDQSPVVGATILVKGTSIGTITDVEGHFSLSGIPTSAHVLQISYIGAKTEEVPVQPTVKVLLKSDALEIDEVMVVAYGTSKKSTFTGSASSIKQEKLEIRPVTGITSALTGATAGVQVLSSNGQPGSEPSIRIRGIGSYSSSNDPLIILDGMPYDNAISSINPSDIESLTVLKDAASSALYGSRAANGVIMITTKKGRQDKMTVNVKFNQGVTARQSGDYRKVGLNDYLTLYWENLRNQYMRDGKAIGEAGELAAHNLFDNLTYNPFNIPRDQVMDSNGQVNPNAQMLWGDDTDWEDAVERLGSRTDASVAISGGSEKTDYYASVGYTNENGYIIGSNYKRYTARANVNSQITKWLKVGTNVSANMSSSKGNQNESSGNNSNPFRFTRFVGPIYPIHLHDPNTGEYLRDENGNLMYDFGTGYNVNGVEIPIREYVSGNNPAKELQDRQDENKRNTINAKVFAEISFLKDFKFTFNGGVGSNSYLASSADIVYAEKGNTGTATKTNTFTTTWTFNELLTYNKDIDKHHVDVLVGHESYDYEYNYLRASMKDQKFPGNYELANYSNINTTPTSYTSRYKTEGYLSRLNYDYDDKYFFSASFRRDGSSRFYKDSRWGNFWSVGGGWRIDRERFMRGLTFVELLKLRASYGEVGNDNIGGYYPWRATYEPAQNATEAGYIQASLGNKNLKWEVSHNLDVALEMGFLGRYSATVEFFNRQSSNLLFAVPLSPSTGMSSQDLNAGTMYNRGVEVELGARLIEKSDFSWGVNFNGTHIKNRVTKLPVDPFVSGVHKVEEGHSRYEFWLRQWAGVDPETGSSLYVPTEEALAESESLVTVNGQTYTTSRNEAEFAYAGESMPKLTGGLSTDLSYKGFSLSLTFYYQLGGKMYDATYSDLMSAGTGSLSYSNLHVDMLDRWQKPGDITNVPRISNGSDATDLEAATSTRWLTSSNMLELSNINLGYTFADPVIKKLGVKGLKLYASAENVFQITTRKGNYPKKNSFSGYTSNGDTYLPARVFTMGLNITF